MVRGRISGQCRNKKTIGTITGGFFGGARREWMMWAKCLRSAPTQARAAQTEG